MEEFEKRQFRYDQLIAGALLVFDEIDNIDATLLIKKIKEDFAEKNQLVEFGGSWECMPFELAGIVKYGTDLNQRVYDSRVFIVEDKRREVACPEIWNSIEERLKRMAGKEMIEYFRTFDKNGYLERKKKRIDHYAKKIPQQARVLLISDSEKEHEIIAKEYGFKKLNWFKSIIRADKYFKEHPEELENYDIIILGSSGVTSVIKRLEIEEKIRALAKEKHIATVELDTELYEEYGTRYDDVHIRACINNSVINYCKRVEAKDYDEVYKVIVEGALTNLILERKSREFKTISDYVNPKKLPLPTKKSDVKILFITSNTGHEETVATCAKKMGLNVDVIEKVNDAFIDHIRNNLGNYDIIITHREDTERAFIVSYLLGESIEQCKDTGRQKVVLATYYSTTLPNEKDKGIIDLCYAYDEQGSRSVTVRVSYGLKEWTIDERLTDETEAILSTMMQVYNKALKKEKIKELYLKKEKEFAMEYEFYCKCKKIHQFLEEFVRRQRNRQLLDEDAKGRNCNGDFIGNIADKYGLGIIDHHIDIVAPFHKHMHHFYIAQDERGRYVVEQRTNNGYAEVPQANKRVLIDIMTEILAIIAERKQAAKSKNSHQKKKNREGRD